MESPFDAGFEGSAYLAQQLGFVDTEQRGLETGRRYRELPQGSPALARVSRSRGHMCWLQC
jgi:hypothetical protein